MELQLVRRFACAVNSGLRSNIGWNNFDADVKNGYSFKPPARWPGLYYFLYLQAADGTVVATNDTTLIALGVPTIDETFEAFFVKKRGLIDQVEVTADLQVLRYKTWRAGVTSDWIDYQPKNA